MTIRQSVPRIRRDPAGRRAGAAAALARACLSASLPDGARREAVTALLALVDDPSPLVRRALAEACADAAGAPRPLVVALARDRPEIAAPVLARSPVLTDTDLVDCAAIGDEAARVAIAGRPHLSPMLCGALAEIAGAAALARLAANPGAGIPRGSLLRLVARHGGDARLREALLARPGLPLDVRHAVTARLADSLSDFVVGRGWLSPERGARVTREARERTTLGLAEGAERHDLRRLVEHLRRNGQLTAGLILRALLSRRIAFAEVALSDLSGLTPERTAGLMHDARGGFATLYHRAGLPGALQPAFAAALSAWREGARGHAPGGPAPSRRMIERALTACEATPDAESRALMALLDRVGAEAAGEGAHPARMPLAA
ncbi:MAG: DUF2336 domain-containing protein [Methylobacterium frigidaeris]